MASEGKEAVIVPRNFYLLAELEDAEKTAEGRGFSYGLTASDDMTLTSWTASIFTRDGNLLSVHMSAGSSYPDVAPQAWFTGELAGRAASVAGSKTSVDGMEAWPVRPDVCTYLRDWRRGCDLKGLLQDLVRRCQ
mmetsp:Transcript_15961/g.55687  ORF Transcript_15961/g.55687 Transcript_15961/m.55687 type:complete len:135 (-) Transcript_15961:240-644(-)